MGSELRLLVSLWGSRFISHYRLHNHEDGNFAVDIKVRGMAEPFLLHHDFLCEGQWRVHGSPKSLSI